MSQFRQYALAREAGLPAILLLNLCRLIDRSGPLSPVHLSSDCPENNIAYFETLGLSYNFRFDLQRLSQCPPRHIYIWCALAAIEHAIRLNPEEPFFYVWIMGQSYYLLGRYKEAVKLFEDVMMSTSQFPHAHKMLVVTYSELGQIEDAEWAAAELLTLLPNFTLSGEIDKNAYKDKTVVRRYIEGYRKAGIE